MRVAINFLSILRFRGGHSRWLYIKLNIFNFIQDDEHGTTVREKRRTSIIYLDVTEATKSKKKKGKPKKKKTKKKKGLKKKNKNRRKNNKKSGSKNKLQDSSSSKNKTHRKGTSSAPSSDWKEIVPESNMSESKLSGENNKNRKPVDIIVHIKVKE